MSGRPRASDGAIAKVAFAASLLLASMAAGPALARNHHHQWHGRGGGGHAVGLTEPEKDAALIMDGATGKVLYSRNSDQIRHPASLTKMMTLYLLFERLRNGQMTMQTEMPISEHASEQHPTKLHLRPGSEIPVEVAIKAIVIHSANDVAVAVAESIGGTESHFAELMTAKARQLGMMHTFYHNASGLPDEMQVTTANDLAILAHHLAYDFPQYFGYFSLPYFNYRGETYATHDNLIGNYEGADGIKTGYTEASGFNLVSSVVRDDHHIIGVVMGGRSAHMRDREMVRLLDDTFVRIAADPALVSRTHVPWRTPQVMADLGAAAVPQPGASDTTLKIGTNGDVEDEDSAEARQDPDDDAAPLKSNVIAPTPRPQPAVGERHAVAVAALTPPPPPPTARPNLPSVRPTPRAAALGEGDIDSAPIPLRRNPVVVALGGVRDWTIQIGAFADMASAKAQLASYAERSLDVLGQAQRIVAPFQAVDGHTLYRARFGPFVEAEARAVCQRLTERGQTCFAATGR